MTYSAFAEILNHYDILLKDVLDNQAGYGVSFDGYGNVLITNWESFKTQLEKKLGHAIDTTSQEYLDAYSAYVDSRIETGSHNKTAAFDQLSAISEAKAGDLLNVAYLEAEFNKAGETAS